MSFRYLVARPGHHAFKSMSTRDYTSPWSVDDINRGYYRHTYVGEPLRCRAFYGDLPQGVLDANDIQTHTDLRIWGGTGANPQVGSYFLAGKLNNGVLAPSIQLDGQTFDPDPHTLNGKQSWGNGQIQCCSYYDDNRGQTFFGYCYIKTLQPGTSLKTARLSTYYANGRWWRNGWYALNWDSLQYLNNEFTASPFGTMRNTQETNVTLNGKLVWNQFSQGGDCTELNFVPDMQQDTSSAGTFRFGLPVWRGELANTSSTAYIIGIPTVDGEDKIRWNFLYSWESPENYYNNHYYKCDELNTAWQDGEVVQSPVPVYTVFKRNNTWPEWDYGWYEFDLPDDFSYGSTLSLRHCFSDHDGGVTAFNLYKFQRPASCKVVYRTDEWNWTTETAWWGLTMGTFNVGSVIM